MKRRNDRGFSLVELVVVIAIMAVLAGLVTIGVSVLNGRQAKECRDELESKLENVRVQTMGKRTVTAKLYETANGGYALTVTSALETDGSDAASTDYSLGGKSCEIYYSCEKDATYATATDLMPVDSSGLEIEFDRASGAQKELSSGVYVYHIFVVQGSKVYGIRFYPETGKMELE